MKPRDFNQKYMAAIDLLQRASKMADQLNKPLWLGFSGGKDSQCLYHLAIAANVPFKAKHQLTTVEPPEVVRFIRRYYPDVIEERQPLSMWRLILKKKHMPTRWERFCCSYYKEMKEPGCVVLTGIRAAESSRRAMRQDVELGAKKVERRWGFSYEDAAEVDNLQSTMVSCLHGSDQIIVNPILSWSDNDVWYYLREFLKVPTCKLYSLGYKRIGCILCPLAGAKERWRDANNYPKYFAAMQRTVSRLRKDGKFLPEHPELSDEQCLNYWMSGDSFDKWYANNISQLSLF